MIVWGLWDRILTEDSKLCLFLHACPTLCLCSLVPIGAGRWFHTHVFHCLREQTGRVDLKCLSVQHSLPHPLHQERGKASEEMMSRIPRMRGSL